MQLHHSLDLLHSALLSWKTKTLTFIEHAQCSAVRGLGYLSFTWDCQGGKKFEQRTDDALANSISAKIGQALSSNDIAVDYDSLDFEDDFQYEVSEMATGNVFTWLRGEDGFPVAERASREHDWIENLESDDDSPIRGDAGSASGGNLGGWLSGSLTTRSIRFDAT